MVQEQTQALERDKKELQTKYELKSGEKRKIEEKLRELQSRVNSGGGGGPGPLPGGGVLSDPYSTHRSSDDKLRGINTHEFRAFHQSSVPMHGGNTLRHSMESVRTIHTCNTSRGAGRGERFFLPESPRGTPRSLGFGGGRTQPMQLTGVHGQGGGKGRPVSPYSRERSREQMSSPARIHHDSRQGHDHAACFRPTSPSRSVLSIGV